MPYFRRNRGMSLRPVNRVKHVFDVQAALALGTVSVDIPISTTDTPTLAAVNSVETGSKIHGIYLHVEVVATSSVSLPNVYMIVFKNPGGNLTRPAPNVVGASDNKK